MSVAEKHEPAERGPAAVAQTRAAAKQSPAEAAGAAAMNPRTRMLIEAPIAAPPTQRAPETIPGTMPSTSCTAFKPAAITPPHSRGAIWV